MTLARNRRREFEPQPAGGRPAANHNGQRVALHADAPQNPSPEAESTATPAPEPEEKWRSIVMPLRILAFLAIAYTLYFARAVLLPLALAIVLYAMLRPVVRLLKRRGVPAIASAPALLGSLALALGISIFFLAGPAQELAQALPQNIETVGRKMRGVTSPIEQIEEARVKLEELAGGKPEDKPMSVQIKQPELTSSAVWLNASIELLASFVVVVVCAFFLLTSGDALINNVIVQMPTIREKRGIVELIDKIQRCVSSYLLSITLINIGTGVVTGVAMALLGLSDPILIGIMVATLNYVPVIGPLICGVAIGFMALLTDASVGWAVVPPLVFFGISIIEGNVVTPLILGKRMAMNPVVVFLYLIFWGWLWGIGGVVLAVPILAMTQIALDQFERTRPIASLMAS